MKRPKNEAIGEVECPQKLCTLKVPVFKFRARGTVTRFAGKLYCECPVHGRYGTDGKEGAQTYLLENATIWGAKPNAAAKDGPAPVKNTPASGQESPALGKPAAPVQRPAPSPSAAAPAKKPRWWEGLNTIIK
jgi:hypothetical protein